jgi:flagellar protein FliO/FliZ
VPPGRPRPFGRLALGLACAFVGFVPQTAVAAPFQRDRTPLPADVSGVGGATAPAAHVASGTGSAALHMLIGLAIVLALIFGLYKLLKRSASKNDKSVADDGWMGVLSTTPLAPSKSLHLVRVGDELILLGSSDGSVTPIRVYGAEEARRLGVDPRLAQALPAAPGSRSAGFGASLLDSLKRMTAR